MLRYDTIWYDMIWCVMLWYSMIVDAMMWYTTLWRFENRPWLRSRGELKAWPMRRTGTGNLAETKRTVQRVSIIIQCPKKGILSKCHGQAISNSLSSHSKVTFFRIPLFGSPFGGRWMIHYYSKLPVSVKHPISSQIRASMINPRSFKADELALNVRRIRQLSYSRFQKYQSRVWTNLKLVGGPWRSSVQCWVVVVVVVAAAVVVVVPN